MKIDSKMTPVSQQALTAQHTAMLVRSIMNDKQAAEFEATKECNFAIAPASIGRFRVNCFIQMGCVGAVLRVITTDDPELRGPEAAARAEGRGHDQARPGALRRRHRLGQVDLAGGDDRLPQRELARPHHHHRGPGRVRPPAQELPDHAARGRRRYRFLAVGAQEHPAPGARRDPDRRDPRHGGDGARGGVRRNRPPGARHAARQQLQPGAWTGSSTSSPSSGATSC